MAPLNKAMMAWFYGKLTRSPAEMNDPRLDIVGHADLHDLPPATVITDEIDPLHDEGWLWRASCRMPASRSTRTTK